LPGPLARLSLAAAVWTCADLAHVRYGTGDRALQMRIRWLAGPGSASTAVEMPTDRHLNRVWLRALADLSLLQSTARMNDRSSADPRGRRLAFVLAALDRSLEGRSHREIASILIGSRAELEWRHQGEHHRDRVRRAIKRGHALMNGGYLALLR
jgi:hypothetical protein